jgi:hypothetical protein
MNVNNVKRTVAAKRENKKRLLSSNNERFELKPNRQGSRESRESKESREGQESKGSSESSETRVRPNLPESLDQHPLLIPELSLLSNNIVEVVLRILHAMVSSSLQYQVCAPAPKPDLIAIIRAKPLPQFPMLAGTNPSILSPHSLLDHSHHLLPFSLEDNPHP